MDRVLEVPIDGVWYGFQTRVEPGYDVGSTEKDIIKEVFLENVYGIEREDLGDTGVVMDIGANIGAFSIYAAALGAKTVYAFEPNTSTWERLIQNIKDNELGDIIRPTKVGIFAENGEQELIGDQGAAFVKDAKGAIEPELLVRLDELDCETIKTISLESAFADKEVAECDVLKIDCEGSEYPLIEAAHPDILKKARYITLEFHPVNAVTFGRLVAKLTHTHNIHIIGRHDTGGQIYARRY